MEQSEFKDRLEQYKNGLFGFVGVYAEAELIDSNNVVQSVHSGGIWGIEDDSDDRYMEEIKIEEIAELNQTLMKDYGFTEQEIEVIEVEDA